MYVFLCRLLSRVPRRRWAALEGPLWHAQVMIDHQQRKLRLIDWGLAEFYHPGKE